MPTTTASASGFTSSLSGLPDQVLLAHTRSLVLHEQALQLAVLDHLREIHARHLHLRLGFSSLFDYAVRELGYSEGAVLAPYQGHAPVLRDRRSCCRAAHASGCRTGSLTLSAAAQLQNTFDLRAARRRRRGGPRRGTRAPELLPGGTGTAPEAGALGAEAAATSGTTVSQPAPAPGRGAAAGAGGAG